MNTFRAAALLGLWSCVSNVALNLKEFTMSVATTIGSSIGKSAAYAKHGTVMTANHSGSFVRDTLSAVSESYRAKDAELAQRRAEYAALRAEAYATIAPPPVVRQRKVTA